jgi:hypothetical protein
MKKDDVRFTSNSLAISKFANFTANLMSPFDHE